MDGRRGKRAILMIDYSFQPIGGAGSRRTLGYVTHLSRFGWRPIVLTVASGDAYYVDRSSLQTVPPEVTVIRTGSFEPMRYVRRFLSSTGEGARLAARSTYRPAVSGQASWIRSVGRWVQFPDRRVGWLPFALARCLVSGLGREIDLIYSTSTAITSHLVARILRIVWDKPWVADFQDPWCWAQESLAMFPSVLHRRAAELLEFAILQAADHVTVTTEPIRDMLTRKHPGIPAGKISVIPMGFEPEWTRRVRHAQDKFTITHLGTFYGPRSPVPFLRALGECLRVHPSMKHSVNVLFFGRFDAATLMETEAAIEEWGLGCVVSLYGPVEHEAAMQKLVDSDLLLLVTDPGTWGRTLVPSKVFEYLGARRPILALAPDGPLAQLLRQVGGAAIVQPTDLSAIAAAIWDFFSLWQQRRLEFAGNEDAIMRLTWARRTQDFVCTIERVMRRANTCVRPSG